MAPNPQFTQDFLRIISYMISLEMFVTFQKPRMWQHLNTSLSPGHSQPGPFKTGRIPVASGCVTPNLFPRHNPAPSPTLTLRSAQEPVWQSWTLDPTLRITPSKGSHFSPQTELKELPQVRLNHWEVYSIRTASGLGNQNHQKQWKLQNTPGDKIILSSTWR